MLERLRQRLAVRLVGKAAAEERAASIIESLIRKNQPPRRGGRELAIAYKTTPWLRALASRVSDAFGAVDWNASVAVNKNSGKTYRSMRLQRANFERRIKLVHWLKQSGELRELDDHPMLDLLSYGNTMLPGKVCMEITCLYLDIIGEAFWALERNPLGMPIEIWPTPPWWVKKTPSKQTETYTIEVQGGRKDIPEHDMLWFRNPDPENPYGRGTGVAEALGDEIDTDEYCAKYTKSFFWNNAIPSAIVSLEGVKEDGVKAAEQKWNNKFRGLWNANRAAFTNAKISMQKLENTFKDQQVIQLREHERDIIQQVFGVPPEIIGHVANSNRATIDSAIYIMALFVLVPRLERVRDVIQQKLAPQFDERIIVGYESPVPGDREFWLRVATANRGAMTRAEWRDAMQLPSHGAVDDVYVMALGEIERRLYGNMPGYSSSTSTEQDGADADSDATPKDDAEPGDGSKRYNKHRVVKRLTDAEIEQVLMSLLPERLTVPMDAVFQKNIEKWGTLKLESVGITGVSFNMLNPVVVEHLSHLAGEQLIGRVDLTTRKALWDTLVEGVRAGESSQVLARRVSDVFVDASDFRAMTIARTEVVHSSNFATFTAYDVAEIVERKQWVSTPDDRTRDEHSALNGQVKNLRAPFEISGFCSMYPGGFGVAHLDVNCRCTITAVISEPKSADQLDMVWKVYDEDLRPWEDEAIDALRGGFNRQRDDVIARLVDIAG